MKTGSNFALWSIASIFLVAALFLSIGHYRGRAVISPGGSADSGTESSAGSMASSRSGTLAGGEGGGRNSNRVSKADAAARAMAVAARLIPLAAKSGSGARPEAGDQEEIVALMEEISHFNANQLKVVLGEVRNSPDLDDNSKAESCGFLLTIMANVDPVSALKLLSELEPLFKGKQEMGVSVIKVMEAVADSQPTRAAEWVLAHPEMFGHPMQLEAAKGRILEGAAKSDPPLAFALMDQMKVVNTAQALSDMIRSAHSNDERILFLRAARKKAAAMNDPSASDQFRSEMLSAMGAAMRRESSTKTDDFIKSAGLDEGERETLLKARDQQN